MLSRVHSSVTLEGIVVDSSGAPAESAVVVSSAGGRAVTDRSGRYRLEVEAPADARTVQVTAAGGIAGRLLASTSVDLVAGAAFARVGPLALASGGACQPSWLPTFGGLTGTNASVSAVAVFDDGSGPALFIGGAFTSASGVTANRVAKWDGDGWVALGSGVSGGSAPQVFALCVFDDGGGSALYAGGVFTSAGGAAANAIARWDGSAWTALGGGVSGSTTPAVYALAAFDDGSGPALYAGGSFTAAGGVSAKNIARWNGASWSSLGAGLAGASFPPFSDLVGALAVFDDGAGPALFAGGAFTLAGGAPANYIARWDGTSWAPLGSGTNKAVRALSVFDDGTGAALYAGGYFTSAGGSPANRMAKWDGSNWTDLGGGMDNPVNALTVFDDGSGPALFAGGVFTSAGAVAASRVAKWDGSGWSALASGMGSTVLALLGSDLDGQPVLVAGADSTSVFVTPGDWVARWDGSSWSAFGNGPNAPVHALSVFDDDGAIALHAGGDFTSSGVLARHVARWDGSNWLPLGSGVTWPTFAAPSVHALAVLDDGAGPGLYVGGLFQSAGGVPANFVARWDSPSFGALGSGVCTTGAYCPGADVLALTAFDDGSGPALYAAGDFTSAGGVPANRIARWDGASWTPLGTGMNDRVQALAVFDDGGGPALYAGGSFASAGGVTVNHVAKWNGVGWSPLGGGTNGSVLALTVFDDGSGRMLYAGGGFTAAGGVAANRIARWDGSSWSPLESGMNGSVRALTVFDDGTGPALYAGGSFTTAGGVAASSIVRWDGTRWDPLGSGTNAAVRALTVFNDRTGPALYAGGDFTSAPDSGDGYLAKWGRPDTNPPTISCPPSVAVDDRRANGPGEVLTFAVTASDEEDPTPSLVCTPPSGSLFRRGTTLVTCTATDFSGNQATCQFTVAVVAKIRIP